MEHWYIFIFINLYIRTVLLTGIIAETRVAADGGANEIYHLNKKSLSRKRHDPSFAGDYVS